MTSRKKIVIALTALLALLALVLFIVSRRTAPATPAPAAETPGEGLEPAAEVPATSEQVSALNPRPAPSNEQGPPGYLQVAELFAERYGSYSNQEPYANLRDLLPIMTDGYRARAEAQIVAASGNPPAASYEGVTSFKVTSRQVELDEAGGAATVDVSLQQSKTVGVSAPEVSYRTLRLELVRAGSAWRVDAAAWRS